MKMSDVFIATLKTGGISNEKTKRGRNLILGP